MPAAAPGAGPPPSSCACQSASGAHVHDCIRYRVAVALRGSSTRQRCFVSLSPGKATPARFTHENVAGAHRPQASARLSRAAFLPARELVPPSAPELVLLRKTAADSLDAQAGNRDRSRCNTTGPVQQPVTGEEMNSIPPRGAGTEAIRHMALHSARSAEPDPATDALHAIHA